jgi:hypothetical protein
MSGLFRATCVLLLASACVDNVGWERRLQNAQDLESQGKLPQAVQQFEEALALTTRLPDEHPYVLTSLGSLARVYLAAGRFADAERIRRRLNPLLERVHGPDHPVTARTLHLLALALRGQNKAEAEQQSLEVRAEDIYHRALEAQRDRIEPDPDAVLKILREMAVFHQESGRAAEAEMHFVRAASLAERIAEPPVQAEVLEEYAGFLESIQQTAKAQELRTRAEQLRAGR